MTLANIVSLLGGLGFFLFGMTLLSDGLKKIAGSKLEMILEKLTSTTFKSVLLGTVVTTAIQSSSATTVMVVGFVNSGIMKLANAIGIIMGANIGTTATGWILLLAGAEGGGISSSTIFAFVAFVGIILNFFCKKPNLKNIGMILLAFSILMNGMQTMSSAMSPLRSSPVFINFIAAVSNPIIALLVGAVFTAIIQSCSASIGILQAMSITGIIGYDVAIPMVVGMCIGACAPILISAIGANIHGKRTAFIYLYFNMFGAVVLLPLFYICHAFMHFDFMSQMATSMGIAVVNTIFNAATTFVLMPVPGVMEKIAVLTVKDKKGEEEEEYNLNMLDERFLEYPSIALEQSGRAIDLMIDASFKNFRKSTNLVENFNAEKYEKILAREERVDKIEDTLGAYLVRVNKKELSEKETQTAAKYLACLTNLERISDHAVNIAELSKELAEKSLRFSDHAVKELNTCVEATMEIISLAQKSIQENSVETANMVEPLEEVIDIMTKECKSNHIQRVQAGNCTLELGFIFNDCLNNIERVASHCSNIAMAVLESANSNVHGHNYLKSIKEGVDNSYQHQLTDYAEKYYSKLMSIE